MPQAQSFACSAVVRNKIYVFGGTTGYRKVQTYDPIMNAWTTLGDMPRARAHGGCANIHGKIYLIGGLDDFNSPVTTVDIFDPLTNTWSVGPVGPILFGHGVVAHETRGLIYVLGGWFRSSGSPGGSAYKNVVWPVNQPLRGGRGQPSMGDLLTNIVYSFNGTTFTAVGNLAAPMAYMGATRVGDAFYLVGGNGGAAPTGVAQRWTVGNTSATLLGTPLIKSYLSSTTVGTTAYFFGGGYNSGTNDTVDNNVYTYNTTLSAWSSDTALKQARYASNASTIDYGRTNEVALPSVVQRLNVSAVGQVIYAVGGSQWKTVGSLNTEVPSKDIYIYTTGPSPSTQTVQMPTPVDNAAVAVLGNKLYIVGGSLGMLIMDIPTKTFTAAAFPSGATSGGAIGTDGTNLYFALNSAGGSQALQKYTVATNTWSTVGPAMPFAGTNYLDGVVLSNQFWVTALDRVYVYDIAGATWTSKANIGISDPRLRVTISGNILHALTYNTSEHYQFDTTNNTWTWVGELLNWKTYPSPTFTQDGKMWAAGGFTSNYQSGQASPTTIVPNPNMESWLSSPVMYVLGGIFSSSSGTQYLSSIEASGGAIVGDVTGRRRAHSSATFRGIAFDDDETVPYAFL